MLQSRACAGRIFPRIKGWGHHSAPILLETKLQLSADQPLIFPHAKATLDDAGSGPASQTLTDLDGLETHDCFTVTEYMAIDHSGLTAPGESWKAVEEGRISRDGDFPINPSGGLIGLGHPVGATGVRMVLDCSRQVSGRPVTARSQARKHDHLQRGRQHHHLCQLRGGCRADEQSLYLRCHTQPAHQGQGQRRPA